MNDEKIDISGYDKAEVLCALYDASKQQGLGLLNSAGKAPLLISEATEFLARATYFDYLGGRVMKVDLGGDYLDPRLYDRDNGTGAALAAISGLRRREKSK